MATKKEDIVAAIEEMSVLDLADLVKTLEDRLGVTAVAAAAPAAAVPAAAKTASAAASRRKMERQAAASACSFASFSRLAASRLPHAQYAQQRSVAFKCGVHTEGGGYCV